MCWLQVDDTKINFESSESVERKTAYSEHHIVRPVFNTSAASVGPRYPKKRSDSSSFHLLPSVLSPYATPKWLLYPTLGALPIFEAGFKSLAGAKCLSRPLVHWIGAALQITVVFHLALAFWTIGYASL